MNIGKGVPRTESRINPYIIGNITFFTVAIFIIEIELNFMIRNIVFDMISALIGNSANFKANF